MNYGATFRGAPKDSGEKGSCNDPEEDTDELYLEFCPGSVVWAKLEGYPWWPAMVDEEPDIEEFYWWDKGILHYNVTFLDAKPTRAWIPERFICHFLKTPEVKKRFLQKPKQNRYDKAISKAKERAEAAMKMTIKDRLETYTFANLYKGHWPSAPNFDESDFEEDENRTVETLADTILKELDELGSIDSSDTEDERIEKGNSEYEYNKLELANIVSKNSESLSSKNAKGITNPLQEKEIKGTKRKKSEKFTPRKQKNFKNITQSLTDEVIDLANSDSEKENNGAMIIGTAPKENDCEVNCNIEEKSTSENNPVHSLTNSIIDLTNNDSGHESDETLNTGSAAKEDDNKDFRDSEEKSTTEDNTIFLPEMSNHEKQKNGKKSYSVKPLTENELKKGKPFPTEKNIHALYLASEEEICKHMDESILEVSKFIENETSVEFNEYRKSEKEKMVNISKEPQTKSTKQKKFLSSGENTKQSKTTIFKKSTIHPLQEPLKPSKPQNSSHSPSKNDNKKITGITKQPKKSQGKTKTLGIKMNEPKQPNSSFYIPIKNAEQKDEMAINDKKGGENVNKEKKMQKFKNQNLSKESSSVKVKPNFKLPIKNNKLIFQAETKNPKIHTEAEKKKEADVNQKNSDLFEENCPKTVIGSGEDENTSVNQKSTKKIQDEKHISEPKENSPQIISSNTVKSSDNEVKNTFEGFVTAYEMDCKTTND